MTFDMWCWRRLLRVPWTSNDIQLVNPKINQYSLEDWCWSSNTLATWCKELTHWKRPWCWRRLNAGGEGDDKGWECWLALPTWWTWVWPSYMSWWWTGKPGMLYPWGCKKADMTEKLNWTDQRLNQSYPYFKAAIKNSYQRDSQNVLIGEHK